MSRKNVGLDFGKFDAEVLGSNSDEFYKNGQDDFDVDHYSSDFDSQDIDVDQFLNDMD